MKAENYTYYEVEVTITKKINVTLDFDEIDTRFDELINYTVEDYAIDEVVKNKQLLLKSKDISKVEVKKVIK